MSNYPPPGGFNPQQPGFQQPGFGGPAPVQKSNKKWLILAGVGCLGLVAIGIVVLVAAIGGGVYMLANSEATKAAATFVANNGAVKDEVGTPVECSFSGGNIESNNGVGTASISLSVTGPKGSGTAAVDLTSSGSENWQVKSATFTGPSGRTTTLK